MFLSEFTIIPFPEYKLPHQTQIISQRAITKLKWEKVENIFRESEEWDKRIKFMDMKI